MVFSSLSFLFGFLPLFLFCYIVLGRRLPIRAQNGILFFFSLLFYAWGEPRYIVLMLYSSVLDYVCGRKIERADSLHRLGWKKFWLIVSLVGNLALLITFKYLGWLIHILNTAAGLSVPDPQIALPIGISFYTFQTMSYSLDVYRKKVPSQRSFLYFGTYVSMFPQLIAGPIVRYDEIAGTLEARTITSSSLANGARRFILGLAKKVLIANTMARTCDALFLSPVSSLGVLGSWTAILSFAIHLYYDFSGYSDMAIGLGCMLGFTYPENFNYPYIARSVTDHWHRWHMTLASFFRDYVYIPLGGSRVSVVRWTLNILITWSLIGLWHGASWNYVFWGLYMAVFLILEKLVFLRFLKKNRFFSHVWTLFWILLSYVIFSQESLPAIVGLYRAMFGVYGLTGTGDVNAFLLLQQSNADTLFLLALVSGILFCMPVLPRLKRKYSAVSDLLGDGMLLILFFASVLQLALGAYNPFIYFRF